MTRLAKVMCRRDDRASRRHRTQGGERAARNQASTAVAIRPFTIETPEADLEDVHARIGATRWPEREAVEDQSQGVQMATMQRDVPIAARTTEGRKTDETEDRIDR